jgi:hypothetical protein
MPHALRPPYPPSGAGGPRLSEPFIFGIPLIARAMASDWATVDRLLSLTLRSLLAQSDGDFRAILAAHDIPDAWSAVASDPRFEVVRAGWPPEPPTAANDDGGRKKWLVKQAVRRLGGGLLMFLDADDWVARDLVATARAAMRPEHVGAVIGDGFALDHASLRMLPFPIGGVFDGPFHGLCGSSTIGRIMTGSDEPCHVDPHMVLGSHHEWIERAEAGGFRLARLATSGVYLVGTGQNHSEARGPFAAWRRDVTRAIRDRGCGLTHEFACRFGQDADALILVGTGDGETSSAAL